MPIPKPGETETQDDYMSRCMGDEYMQEFPQEQRAAVCGTQWREAQASKADWDTAYVNDLPDSAFLYVEPGGEKDDSGKTTPRSLRHFPYRSSSGAIDLPHLRNALSRIPQSDLPADAKERAAARARSLLEDANKAERIQGVAGVKVAKPEKLRIAKPAELFLGDDEKRLLYGVVYAPDEVDSHGDQADADTIEEAAHGFMAAPLVGIQHEKEAPARVVESYIARQDLIIGKRVVTKGSWVVAIKVEDDELWGQVKQGAFGGLSLGGYAEREVDDA